MGGVGWVTRIGIKIKLHFPLISPLVYFIFFKSVLRSFADSSMSKTFEKGEVSSEKI